MSENWKIQVSPKLSDGTLVNLRAETPDEAANILDWAIANAAKIGEAVQAVNAVSVVAGAFPGSQVVQVQATQQGTVQPQAIQQQGPWSQQGTQQAPPPFVPQQQAAPQQQEAQIPPQFCSHGQMTLRHNKPGASKKWSAYMCPTPQGTPGQCKPVDAKTGKSWD